MTGLDTVVRLSGVVRDYGGVRAIDRLDLAARRGEVLALLGPSGCGKTTTLRVIAGFERPDAGEVEVSGVVVASGKSFVQPEKRRIGMVFQDYALFPHLTVARNIAYGLGGSGKPPAARVREVLALTRLEGLGERMPHELSGGQQQRVALARAIAPGPDLILLDEPFSNLDAALRTRVRREMRAILSEAGATTVFVTHDQEEALSLADRVAVIFDGRVAQVASPETLYQNPASREVAAFVGEANFLPGTVSGGMARCALGGVPAHEYPDGPVEVMVRPEDVSLDAERGGNAKVVEREFFGYGQFIRLKLDDGAEITARTNGDRGLEGRVRAGAERGVVFPENPRTYE
ncbi:ABC transporter ATP-binding protein [Rubrobacter indicoceani]|uniref:ABC transporter ATP-binding protein n=1 Tax=Rubrobacter indicoceani TaxID=2051957 RepID=UPI000E5AD587|nr:ABC transporter ATP-binding protein [Rubrobacter indicoceani]